ncbi:MAG TPA: hypothetical protein VGB87_09345, partial [Vicinamibacteria bacterium]
WGTTSVQRGDQWATTSRATNRATGTTTRVTRGSEGGAALTRNRPGTGADSGIARTGSGDVYAGRDGNVYRNQGGSWQKYDNGGWNNVDTPQRPSGQAAATQARDRSTTGASAGGGWDSATREQLNRDSRARSEGSQRTRDYSSYQRSGGSRSSASTYRPSGGRGGARGGGRRR